MLLGVPAEACRLRQPPELAVPGHIPLSPGQPLAELQYRGVNEARRALQAGKSSAEAIQAAKSVGAFSGEPLGSNLINQLNHWGFHKWLALTDSADLFSTSRHLVSAAPLT